MDMQGLTRQFIQSRNWTVSQPKGFPQPSPDPLAPRVTIPQDVLNFYALCGGLESVINRDEDIFLSVVAPDEVVWAPRAILGHALDQQAEQLRNDILWYWYIIGRGDTDEYFMIDLNPERHEKCYFTTVYFFGQRGWNPIVANSFAGLLESFLQAASVGEDWSWRDESWGDAYE